MKKSSSHHPKVFSSFRFNVLFFAVLLILLFSWLKAFEWMISTIPLIVVYIYPQKTQHLFNRLRTKYKIVRFTLEWSSILVISFLAVSVFYQHFFDITSITDSSMKNELQPSQLVIVNKLATGSRVYPDYGQIYHRSFSFGNIDRNELLYFNFPEGDSVLNKKYSKSYYYLRRAFSFSGAYQELLNKEQLTYKTVTEREPMVQRIMALPGDKLEYRQGIAYINDKPLNIKNNEIDLYRIRRENLDILKHCRQPIETFTDQSHENYFYVELDSVNLCEINKSLIEPVVEPQFQPNMLIFPHSPFFPWNSDNMGPVVIPQKDVTVDINLFNVDLYRRIIEVYEGNRLVILNKRIYINGLEASQYTFKMNYYWMAGDNRVHAYDSKYWGFLPENHIIGKAIPLPLYKPFL